MYDPYLSQVTIIFVNGHRTQHYFVGEEIDIETNSIKLTRGPGYVDRQHCSAAASFFGHFCYKI